MTVVSPGTQRLPIWNPWGGAMRCSLVGTTGNKRSDSSMQACIYLSLASDAFFVKA